MSDLERQNNDKQSVDDEPPLSFAEVLRTMPDVGCDSDFERKDDNEDREIFS